MNFGRCALAALSVLGLVVSSTSSFACDDPRRITGGKDADIKDHPWQVALDIEGELCGGVLIEPRWVLTAAHCFDSDDASKVKVKAGVTNYRAGGTWSPVDRVVRHKFDRATKENDLALVKVKRRPAAVEINLGGPELVLEQCQELEVTGWGRLNANKGGASAKLQKAIVPFVDNNTCNEPKSYNNRVRSGMMCAGYPGIDACTGDSGGPLVLRRSDEKGGNVLLGIISWGEDCGKKFGVYTRVSAYREWIRSVIAAHGK